MKKKSFNKTVNENELSFEEDFDESGFDVVPLGSPVSSFSFCSDSTETNSSNNSKDILINKTTKDIYTHENLIDNRYGKHVCARARLLRLENEACYP